MEKLKGKHDHSLTKILKVLVFAIILLMPFLVFLPTALYYGCNEHAPIANGQRNEITLKQQIINGKPNSLDYWIDSREYFEYEPLDSYLYSTSAVNSTLINNNIISNTDNGDIMFLQFENFISYSPQNNGIEVMIQGDNDLYFSINFNISQNFSKYYAIAQFTQNETSGKLTFNFNGLYQDIGFKNIQLFNLTKIYGTGNEPNAEEFATFIGENYYEYGQDYTITLSRYWSITDNMSLAWETMWETPLFAWTNNTPFTATTNAFTNVFNISQASGFYNLIAYIITIVCIYLIIDIVIGIATMLTHMIAKQD